MIIANRKKSWLGCVELGAEAWKKLGVGLVSGAESLETALCFLVLVPQVLEQQQQRKECYNSLNEKY